MKCYHCARIDHESYFQIRDAVGICQQCGAGVCAKHVVKSDVPLPGDGRGELERTHPALLPLLCPACYSEINDLERAAAETQNSLT